MTEVGRQLRYAVPGGVFELFVGLWLYIDARLYPCAEPAAVVRALDPPSPGVTLLLIGAAFPLGYLISVVANEIAWFRLRFRPEARVLGRIQTGRVLRIIRAGRRYRRWLATVQADMSHHGDRRTERQDEEAFVELVQRMAFTGTQYGAAVARVRSLADLMNSLLNSGVAVLLGMLWCAGIFAVTARSGGADALTGRLAVLAAFSAVAILLLICISAAERRVANIADAFVVGMIRGTWRGDD